jgi:hypothetical protein
MTLRATLERSVFWLTIYVLCVVFVFSFILFEVLDVDGSDFRVVATQAIAAEASHADIRKLQLGAPPDNLVTPLVLWALWVPDRILTSEATLVAPPPQMPPRDQHWLLPRASLADLPPSA